MRVLDWQIKLYIFLLTDNELDNHNQKRAMDERISFCRHMVAWSRAGETTSVQAPGASTSLSLRLSRWESKLCRRSTPTRLDDSGCNFVPYPAWVWDNFLPMEERELNSIKNTAILDEPIETPWVKITEPRVDCKMQFDYILFVDIAQISLGFLTLPCCRVNKNVITFFTKFE